MECEQVNEWKSHLTSYSVVSWCGKKRWKTSSPVIMSKDEEKGDVLLFRLITEESEGRQNGKKKF